MDQVIQVLGSLLILAAFGAAQRGVLDQDSRTYLTLNLVGSLVLGVLAAYEKQLGFLLLETCWAAVSAWSLYRSSPNAVTVSDREPPESRCSQR